MRCWFSLKEHELSPPLHVSHHIYSGAGEEKTPRSEYNHSYVLYMEQKSEFCRVCWGGEKKIINMRLVARQIIEKRRRDRINNSLSELRRLVPSAFEKQVRGGGKKKKSAEEKCDQPSSM